MTYRGFVVRNRMAGASLQRDGLCAAAAMGLALLGLWTAIALPAPPQLFPQQDKLEHFLAFGALAALVSVHARRMAGRLAAIGALTLIVEIGQAALTTTRQASWPDVFAGLLGVLFAAGAIQLWREVRKLAAPTTLRAA
ncbi:MAG: hypothetical protein NW203_01120 [Hyphomonadaceae bacterium]|nr:hypothetical protein [Hyphomonadaceae bacterium]